MTFPRIILIKAFCCCFSFCIAQNKLSITPGIGWQALQCRVVRDTTTDEGFKPFNAFPTFAFNLSVQFDLQQDWLFFAALNVNRSTISYKFKGGGLSHQQLLTYPSLNLQTGVHKTLKTHHWLKVNPRNRFVWKVMKEDSLVGNYLLLFRSKLIGGYSLDMINDRPGANSNTIGFTAFIGIGLQFFNEERDGLQINFIYAQGLTTPTVLEVNYNTYSGKLACRGSYFTIQIAYPLMIASTRWKRS
jgi:hypothetical protein